MDMERRKAKAEGGGEPPENVQQNHRIQAAAQAQGKAHSRCRVADEGSPHRLDGIRAALP